MVSIAGAKARAKLRVFRAARQQNSIRRRFLQNVRAVSGGQDAATSTDSALDASGTEAVGVSPPPFPMYQAPQYYQSTSGYRNVQPVAPMAPQSSGGPPFWVWLLVGAGLMWVFGKVQEFRRNPFAFMAGLAGKFTGPSGAPSGRGAPSGAGGGMDLAAMMQMMQQQAQGSSSSPFPTDSAPTINATASEVKPAASSRDGSKFEAKRTEGTRGTTPSTTEAGKEEWSATPNVTDSPSPSSEMDKSGASNKNATFFDAGPTAGKAKPASSPFFADTKTGDSAGGTAGAGKAESADETEKLMENMLDMLIENPEMQKQLNQHLPEGMRDEATWQWIKSSPEVRKQLAKQMAPSLKEQYGDLSSFVSNPTMMTDDMKKAMDQMRSQGVDPDEMMGKMMKDPELMQLMTKPHVANAIMDIQKNPDKAIQYMNDPDIAKMMMKMMQFSPMVGDPSQGQASSPTGSQADARSADNATNTAR